MTKEIMVFILIYFYCSNVFAGISILGSRFIMNENPLNITIMNDDENEYIIKSEINDVRFIVSPPLFLLSKNSKNIITLVPTEKISNAMDEVLDLKITAIPKSMENEKGNAISLAIRNNFKLITRHKRIKDSDFLNLKIEKLDNEFYLLNNSSFAFTISLNEKDVVNKIKTLPPKEKLNLGHKCNNSSCDLSINFYNEFNDIIKTIDLSYK
ncbi:fimbria/pilus periplasmic chaperone [Providencia stuartii]|uniref:fimbria/pilus periplasmic chaperone n=1 Tax=Providencia stuartii TaxID=588 RepID=UPI00111CC0F0|nr:fimbria/pilus periplasmic chaperone [Providencia stuartii]